MMPQQEPGRIVSIVDEHATFETGVVAPIPKNQSFGELVVFVVILIMFGAIAVVVALKVFDFITVDEPVYNEPPQTRGPVNTIPRE